VNLFQILSLSVVSILLILSIAATARGWTTRGGGIAWIGVWFAAGIALARPEWTKVIAEKLGIGRGADLVLYCAVIAMMTGFFMTYTRLRHLRRDVTLLTRQLALRDAEQGIQPREPRDS